MSVAHILGFPRIGADRELKKAVEAYWHGKISRSDLEQTGKNLRATHWKLQADAGLDMVSVGDFAWYDHVLEMSVLLGVVPPRYGHTGGNVDLDTLFRMARGRAPTGEDTTACEMTKWFDTNYHYIVPEFSADQSFSLSSTHLFDHITEAQQANHKVKPVLLGLLSYLWLGKTKGENFDKLSMLDKLIPVYVEILNKLASQGVTWVQIDEPILVLDLPEQWKNAFSKVYEQLRVEGLKYLLATYFGALEDNLAIATQLPVDGLHVDLVRAPEQLESVVAALPNDKILSAGIIDGRNIWKANLEECINKVASIGDRLWVAPSCSLLHTPVDLDNETRLDAEIKNWLAFAKQKLSETVVIKRALTEGKNAVAAELDANKQANITRQQSTRIHKPEVKERVAAATDEMANRENKYAIRAKIQQQTYNLPKYPTTTIGSFPQTVEIRKARRDHKTGNLSTEEYTKQMRAEIELVVRKQEQMGLDVLVHGEAERNDMVEYFGELLEGFAFTQNGWVQSYGSRCVKPPIIFGDVKRPNAMTVEWSTYAQSLTSKPMKGMLTGPVTILQWSFVRDDQPRDQTCEQIALALRDEVVDLEQAGITIIQIDEPAYREGLPLRKKDWQSYLDWAVRSFRISASGVKDSTQIHTHMCYSEFNDIMPSIAAMDADVITIETSRSDMELLDAFEDFDYPNEIGPGVYDIHSPRVPAKEEMVNLMKKATKYVPAERLWVNPDCGLKTRGWTETEEALTSMVQAAEELRAA